MNFEMLFCVDFGAKMEPKLMPEPVPKCVEFSIDFCKYWLNITNIDFVEQKEDFMKILVSLGETYEKGVHRINY